VRSTARERKSLVRAKCCAVAAGILVQEILKPDVFWYNAGLPENLPGINFGGPDGKVSASRTPLHAPADNSNIPRLTHLADRL